VIPQIRSFGWNDAEHDPDEASVRLIVGPQGGDGEESFDLMVVTPRRLAALLRRDGAVVGRHYLFVGEMDRPYIERFLQDRMRRIAGDTWREVAEKVGRIAHWEFEDYAK
jgi:hypothetical protein